jgi:hypothetical protein
LSFIERRGTADRWQARITTQHRRKIQQETSMSKGNKETKKPKRVAPLAKAPATGIATPMPSGGFRPVQRKKWPTT